MIPAKELNGKSCFLIVFFVYAFSFAIYHNDALGFHGSDILRTTYERPLWLQIGLAGVSMLLVKALILKNKSYPRRRVSLALMCISLIWFFSFQRITVSGREARVKVSFLCYSYKSISFDKSEGVKHSIRRTSNYFLVFMKNKKNESLVVDVFFGGGFSDFLEKIPETEGSH